MAVDYNAVASAVIRSLSGQRWVWPPLEVRELYPSPTGKIRLRGAPVISVISVKSYQTGELLDYTLFKNGRLELAPVEQWPERCHRHNDRVDVTYQYGSEPPVGIQNAITVLADEMQAADSNSATCRLPERVTSINRQGTSWTLIDPMDFVDKGRTGIVEIDMILKATGQPRARARVFSPEFPPPDRISSSIVPVTP